jgi:hypothetical protein
MDVKRKKERGKKRSEPGKEIQSLNIIASIRFLAYLNMDRTG